jgi:transposase
VNREALLALAKEDLVALILAQQARITALEAKLAGPPETPDNSSLPPSKGQKPNLPDRLKKPRPGHSGVARALAERPGRIIVARLAACPHCNYALGPAD